MKRCFAFLSVVVLAFGSFCPLRVIAKIFWGYRIDMGMPVSICNSTDESDCRI